MTSVHTQRFSFENGIFTPDFLVSKLEKELLDDFCKSLDKKGFRYLSTPSTITHDTLDRQGVANLEMAYDLNDGTCLNGSAEQAILQYFAGTDFSKDHCPSPLRIYAFNQCWRREGGKFEPLVRCKEFKKVEQFVFAETELDAALSFCEVLQNSIDFLEKWDITYRTVDVTKRDPGYHVQKTDIEILTKRWGWVESHSCTYFGDEQTKRFGITGMPYTVSNTGIASPRILLPFIEELMEEEPELWR